MRDRGRTNRSAARVRRSERVESAVSRRLTQRNADASCCSVAWTFAETQPSTKWTAMCVAKATWRPFTARIRRLRRSWTAT